MLNRNLAFEILKTKFELSTFLDFKFSDTYEDQC